MYRAAVVLGILLVAGVAPWPSAHPVTVAQFRAFVEATGYVTSPERFAGKRLSTEVEWEHAARGANRSE